MHPATARALVALVLGREPAAAPEPAQRARPAGAGESPEPPVVLDPFCGSGTVLIEARRAGARAIGVDLNPLAVRIARASTWAPTAAQRRALRRAAGDIAADAIAAGKAARRADFERQPHRAPVGADAARRDRLIAAWFAPHVRRELEHIAGRIDGLARRGGDAPGAGDPAVANALTVALSSVLYQVSRRGSDTDATPVDRRVARGAAARAFQRRVELLEAGLAALAGPASGRGADRREAREPVIHCADARDLAAAGLAAASVDAVVTSPPYAGTYDYADQHRLRLDFLGLSSARLDAGELAPRRAFAGGDTRARRRARRAWTRDLGAALAEIARVLRPGGRAAIALGDSVAGTRAMWADEAIEAALPAGLVLVAWAWQSRPVLGGLERNAFGDRPKREFVFLLERPGHPPRD